MAKLRSFMPSHVLRMRFGNLISPTDRCWKPASADCSSSLNIQSFGGVSHMLCSFLSNFCSVIVLTLQSADELMLHHHLCILIMIDAVEIASRQDILQRMLTTRCEAEGSLLNCLKFGLSNDFTIPERHGADSYSGSFPLVAIDPYPHHVVACLQLLWKGTIPQT